VLAVPEGAGASGGRAARRERLARRRKALGLTQEHLAVLLAVERSTVVRWERGDTEPLPRIRPKLAKALKVSPERIEVLLAGDESARRAAMSPTVPRQLPAAAADFTGRAAEVQALTRMLDAAADGAGTVVVSAIGGTAGVGKTALAVHWAHQMADRFPDGQLYVNLRGFDPSNTPMAPEQAIRGFLDALAVPAERIPADPDVQASLYRSLLADRRTLIVLDNARDAAQVRPLLPSSPGCLVVVTSRSQLTGLAAAEGARLLCLDVLTGAEARELLARRLGSERAAAEPRAVAEIIESCARLPLALTIVAARTAARPDFPLATLAAELHDARRRLDALDVGDPATSVRAVFFWSYQNLTDGAARLFRLLGLHPGPDISAPAAASLAAIPLTEARRLLSELCQANLLAEQLPGRYAFHDLLCAYAAELARSRDSEAERRTAIHRLLDHYLHTSHAANRLLNPDLEPLNLAPPQSGVVLEDPANHQLAMAWFDAEHRVLLVAVVLAADAGFDSHAWQLPWTLARFFRRRGLWDHDAATQHTALAAAIRLGDLAAQAHAHLDIGLAQSLLGSYPDAHRHFQDALNLYKRLGNHTGQARSYRGIGGVLERQGQYREALEHSQQALSLSRAAGDRIEQAKALNNVGWHHTQLGNHRQALTYCEEALDLHRELGNPYGEAATWDSLGDAHHHLGHHWDAIGCYRRALALCREFGHRYDQAEVLTHLGDAHHAAGDLDAARVAWRQALDILDELGRPSADKIRAKLASADE
jgi:tetratricopeptide (TPR) repeat protein/transcriptional regulator with XRE-family HTH domain